LQYLDKENKMNSRIIYTTDEGTVAILIPTDECGLSIEEIAAKDVPEGKEYKIVDVSELSSDRTFRNAWVLDNEITVDIPKAKVITKNKLREERKPLLEAQDILFMQAQESGTDISSIVTEKQRLRDITNQVDNMTTVDELKGATI
jgi:hypothetical protein|tara:strand:+ start:122 stop:559 length:438 start_codon:yes stop_codon:yes gene_type:complete